VLGNFTADAASFAKLETLTVAGALSAATGGYAKLTNLTIRNDVTIALSLSGLDTLTVEAGELTVPAVAGGVDGLTLTVGAKGVLTLTGALTGLNDSVVSGTLTATGLAFNSLPDVPPTLTATVDAVINGIAFTGVRTNISALATDAVTTGDFEVPENKTLTIPAATTLTIAAGSALTYDGPVTITATGNLVLATASTTSVASIAGTGTISAGVTTIRGSWAAVGETTEAGTVTIQSAAIGATITADGTEATGLKASAAGAIITQSAGASNTLSIGADTTIDLSEFGSLVLRGAASNSGTAKLTADTAIIKGGGGSTDVDESKITSLGGIVKATAIGDDLTFTGSGDGTNDPFGTIIGAASDNTLTAGGAGDDLTLDKTTILVIGT
jgi:hypothetical protein